MSANTMIRVSDLVKQYDTKTALAGVSFDVHGGEILGLLGPNGAGKSTTMKILTTFLTATSGSVVVDGVDANVDPVAVRAGIGYLPESTPLYADMVVYDYLQYVGSMRGFAKAELHKRIAEVVRMVGLQEYVGFQIANLSKGYKQRVGLAQALLHNPKVLILDEPTSGLDPNQIIEIRNLIRELGSNHTIILSSHNLAEVRQICDRVVIIHRGKVVADGTLDELEGRVAATHRLVVGVQAKAGSDKQQLTNDLKALPGVVSAQLSFESAAPVAHSTFEIEANTDLRADLFRWAEKNGHTLLELRRKALDLEGIFQSLTQDAQA
jgi:ABC-2 type transport system ATP-binding protein